jgi:hypothetical protein
MQLVKAVEEQRCHLNKKSVVLVPVQKPESLSRTCPRAATPLSCGTKNGLLKPIIPLIELVVTDTELREFDAFTVALIEFPASS